MSNSIGRIGEKQSVGGQFLSRIGDTIARTNFALASDSFNQGNAFIRSGATLPKPSGAGQKLDITV